MLHLWQYRTMETTTKQTPVQIAIAEFIPEPCDCVIKHEEKLYEEWFNNLRANP